MEDKKSNQNEIIEEESPIKQKLIKNENNQLKSGEKARRNSTKNERRKRI